MLVNKIKTYLIPFFALLTLIPFFSSSSALFLGLILAVLFGNPHVGKVKLLIHKFLALSVIGLGAGMNLETISKVGIRGVGYTVLGILGAFLISSILYKWLKTKGDVSLLITVGTAICGGSAIAAVSPTIKAKHTDISVALGIIFILNAIALFIFPHIGHYFNLSQEQFGLWAALSIHDTSSVVGATLQYGSKAMEVGTTVKLARALWIIPLAITIASLRKYFIQSEESNQKNVKGKKPLFILGFLLVAALVTWFPSLTEVGLKVEFMAKRLMVLTLFLIGSTLTRETIRSVGIRPLTFATLLWIITASITLFLIYNHWIQV